MLTQSRLSIRTVPWIIAFNIAVFFLWMYPLFPGTPFMVRNFLVSWDHLESGRFWTLLTAVFSHNAFWHIFLNMYVLLSFGSILEELLGSFRFLSFYLIAGLFSSFCHAFVSAFILGDSSIPALGASGAVSGLVILFALTYPREKLLIFGLIPIPAIFGALLFVSLDLWGLMAQAGGGGLPIGHGAHLGGALAGFLYFQFWMKRRLVRP